MLGIRPKVKIKLKRTKRTKRTKINNNKIESTMLVCLTIILLQI